ncbi:MAG: alpha/beta hydrolase [Solirubrobacterales bacterium]
MPERFEFTGSGGDALAARIDQPAGESRAIALFAHCFTCGKDLGAANAITRALNGAGLAVLRFDFTGLGSSEGEFANTNFSSNVADLVAAADNLRERFEAPRLLIGHSLGGAAALASAGEIGELKAVATIAAPFDPGHVEHLMEGSVAEIEREGQADVTLAGRRFRVRRSFLEDIRSQELLPRIARLGRALLVLHGPHDELVPIENARRIFDAAKHPKSFVSLDDADHLLTSRPDATYAGRVLGAWAARYVGG